MKKSNVSKIEIPLPEKKEKKNLIQAEINPDLYSAADAARLARGITKREMIEYGLKMFVLKSNPEAARKLGIVSSEPSNTK